MVYNNSLELFLEHKSDFYHRFSEKRCQKNLSVKDFGMIFWKLISQQPRPKKYDTYVLQIKTNNIFYWLMKLVSKCTQLKNCINSLKNHPRIFWQNFIGFLLEIDDRNGALCSPLLWEKTFLYCEHFS